MTSGRKTGWWLIINLKSAVMGLCSHREWEITACKDSDKQIFSRSGATNSFGNRICPQMREVLVMSEFGTNNEVYTCYTSRMNRTKQRGLSQRPVLEWASFSNTCGFQVQLSLVFFHLVFMSELLNQSFSITIHYFFLQNIVCNSICG